MTAFRRSLAKRGLRGVRLITSGAHEGLKQAVATVLGGAQRLVAIVLFERASSPRGATRWIDSGMRRWAQSRRRIPYAIADHWEV